MIAIASLFIASILACIPRILYIRRKLKSGQGNKKVESVTIEVKEDGDSQQVFVKKTRKVLVGTE